MGSPLLAQGGPLLHSLEPGSSRHGVTFRVPFILHAASGPGSALYAGRRWLSVSSSPWFPPALAREFPRPSFPNRELLVPGVSLEILCPALSNGLPDFCDLGQLASLGAVLPICTGPR